MSDTQIWHKRVASIHFRIGEAKNPGPDTSEVLQSLPGLTLGAINPTGILRKSSSLLELPRCKHVILGVSESHLTLPGIKKFRQELRCTAPEFSFYPGAPAPHRSAALTSIGGTHVGTGFLTTQPARNLQPMWTDDQWNQARFTMSTFLHNEIWITGAVVYAYAQNAATEKVRAQTDKLLEIATDRIVRHATGCRFIMGDFNQLPNALEQTALWESLGWQEVQVIQQTRHDIDIQPTCKQKTTKDFIYVSPELAPFFQTVEVINNVYPDHAALVAHFEPFGQAETIFRWRQPKPIQWENIKQPLPSGDYTISFDDPAEKICMEFAQEFERRVDHHLRNNHQVKLTEGQKGRCKTMQPSKQQVHTKPLKAGRHGEVQPQYQGQSLQHQRMFTQLRRFASLLRLMHHTPLSSSQHVHAEREWRAILRAPGFGRGFAHWWENLPDKPFNSPTHIPHDLPCLANLLLIQVVTDREIRRVEALMYKEHQEKAKNSRIANPHKIFRDLAKPTAAPVQLLDHSKQAHVMAVDESDFSMILDCDPGFTDGPLTGFHGVFSPIHVCEDQIWVEATDLQPVGSRIVQQHTLGSLPELFKQFGDEWMQRWDKHNDLPTDHWQPLEEFIDHAIPQHPVVPDRPITYEEWYEAVKRKKQRSAVGPDGIAKLDILHLPRDMTDQLLRWFHHIECSHGDWPLQWLTGVVHCLEKTSGASKVSHYRPITILSLMFRTWSSLRARQALQMLKDKVSGTCYGSVPGRSATQMWLGIQSLMESAAEDATKCSGAVLDIEKCFNHIPRIPTLTILAKLGMQTGTIRAWGKALNKLTRRFSIRRSIGPGHRSSSGFAEGCSLSVVAMLGINYLIDTWTRIKASQSTVWSFVDNLEVTSADPNHTVQAFCAMESILKALDLPIDYAKTYLWANDTEARKFFQQSTHKVMKSCRDLGGHMQYTRVATNASVTSKIDKFAPRWQTLCLSPAPYAQKVMALKTVVWPNVLHGIASAHLGDQHFDHLRTQAMQALRESKPGTSPSIHLGLCEHPVSDPGCYALLTTVSQFRQCIDPDYAKPILQRLTLSPWRVRPEVGPCSVLLKRLRQVRWNWDPRGYAVDQADSPIDLWECPVQEIRVRLIEAWQTYVATTAASRKTFQGMQHTSATLTVEQMPSAPKDRAIMLTALNGTFFTADHLRKRDPEATDECHLCGQPDSIFHRNWECEALAEARSHITAADCQDILAMTPAMYNHGWVPMPESVERLRQMLTEIPIPDEPMFPFEHVPNHIHVFTDGACEYPQDPFKRLCSWGVTVANPQDLWEFRAATSGVLFGRSQSIVRAELTALLEALRLVWKYQCAATIWLDNLGVYKQACFARNHPDHVWRCTVKNHDLLNTLCNWIRQIGPQRLQFRKVMSHQDNKGAEDAAELWAFEGNSQADAVAGKAILQFPELQDQWEQVGRDLQVTRRLRDQLHLMLLKLGTLSIQKVAKVLQQEPVQTVRPTPVIMQPWQFPHELPPAALKFNIPEVAVLFQWIRELQQGTEEPIRWSWWELYVDVNLQHVQCSPWFCSKTKTWKGADTHQPVPFLKRVRSFAQYITKLAKFLDIQLPTQLACPAGSMISFWATTLPVVVPHTRVTAVDQWMGQWLTGAGKTADLRVIP